MCYFGFWRRLTSPEAKFCDHCQHQLQNKAPRVVVCMQGLSAHFAFPPLLRIGIDTFRCHMEAAVLLLSRA